MNLTFGPKLGLAIATAIISPVAAQLCDVGNLEIKSQVELNHLVQNCTALAGQLTLGKYYTGSLVFHNVTNITSSTITAVSGTADSGVTSIELPDLVTAGSFAVNGITTLEKLSFPKLEYVEHLSLWFSAMVDELEFPSLRNASEIQLNGNFSKVSFDALQTVYGALEICNTELCHEDLSAQTLMNISLAALEHVMRLDVSGKVSSLAAPELTTVALPGSAGFPDLRLSLKGQPVAVTFPKLEHIVENATAYFQGNITSLSSLPALKTYPWLFNVITDESLDIDLPVENAGQINLQGNIQSASFPNLRNFTWVAVMTDSKFDCDSLLDALEQTATNVTVVKDVNVICDTGAGRRLKSLGGGSMAAMTAVVTLVGLLLF
ncbi:hypothetical protein BJX62DRAFT_235819 [Aspergillus germanicus]